MCLNWFQKKKYGIDKPGVLDPIGYSEIVSIIQAEFSIPEYHSGNFMYFICDKDYRTTTVAELKRFLAWNSIDSRMYVSEYYDCDDFAFSLLGEISIPGWSQLPIGLVLAQTSPTAAHAFNCFIDNESNFWFIEPQNDNVFRPADKPNWKPYHIMI